MAKDGVCHVEWYSTEAPARSGAGASGAAPGSGRSPNAYILVDDVEGYVARAAELGGKASEAKTEVPGVGWIAFLDDPDGNRVGLFQGATS